MTWEVIVASIATAVIALLTFLNVRVARRTLSVIERQQHSQSGPFLKLDMDISPVMQLQLPGSESHAQLIELPELKTWADSEPSAPHRFVNVLLENIQKDASGVATGVLFQVTFRFPERGVIDTFIEYEHTFKGFFLEPGEKFILTIADLKAVPSAHIDLSKIVYYDIYRNVYKQAYGYSRVDIINPTEYQRSFKALS